MTERRIFFTAHAEARRRACAAVMECPDGWRVTVEPPKRSGEQNALLHLALAVIASQVEWHGQKFTVDVWKRLCMAAFLREKREQPVLIPALDGNGFDVIFERTSKLSKTQCSELIEWCFAFGAEHGAIFDR